MSGPVRVLVVGDSILDRDVHGDVSRVAPDAPVPVVDVVERRERPGGAGLAALLLTESGAQVTLASCTGDDEAGARVCELLADAGVDLLELARVPRTRRVTRIRSEGQSLLRLDDQGYGMEEGDAVDAAALRRAIASCDAVHVADYGAGLAAHPAVRQVLADSGGLVPLVWDPHRRGPAPVPGAAVVTPNRAEVAHFMQALGLRPAYPALESAAEALRRHWRAGAVAATDGARGVFTTREGSPPLFTPTPMKVPGDTCGAGDRFAGAVAAALGAGAGVPEAVRTAVADVAAWLSRGGVAAESQQDTPPDAVILRGGEAHRDLRELPPAAAAVRTGGGTVVATGGCFDVLHAGHVASLQAARRLGDCLVVLLNSDDSVRRLKGPGRPVHGVEDRRRVLESLECVDGVVVFEDDDPRAALARLRPDVWAKGGDYTEETLPEAALLREWGGRLVLLPYLPDRSTTRILAHADADGWADGDGHADGDGWAEPAPSREAAP